MGLPDRVFEALRGRWIARPEDFIFCRVLATGRDNQAEVCGVVILDHQGTILMDTLVRAGCSVATEIQEAYQIRAEALVSAPVFSEVMRRILEFQCHHPQPIMSLPDRQCAYLRQSVLFEYIEDCFEGLDTFEESALCIRRLYSEFKGLYDYKSGQYKKFSIAEMAKHFKVYPPKERSLQAECAFVRELFMAMVMA